jgi:hypothetical protein
MPNLRIPLHGKLPNVCMTCGGEASHRIWRRFQVDGILVSGATLLHQVPACWSCCCTVHTMERCRAWFWLLLLPVMAASIVGVGQASLALAWLPWLVPALQVGLALRARRRVALPCLALGSRYMLLKVRCQTFVDAFRAALPEEEPLDRIERMLCEGYSRREPALALEKAGLSARDAFETVARFESERKSYFRLQGMRLMARGLALLLPLGIVAVIVPGGPLALRWSLRPLLMGVKLVLTGSGQRL